MSGRGRSSSRKGLATIMVSVKMTPDEIVKLDELRELRAGVRGDMLDSRADVMRRTIADAHADRHALEALRRPK